VPLSQVVLLQINPPERHGQAMAVFGIGTIVGPICRPVLGGWLTYDYRWRWVFHIKSASWYRRRFGDGGFRPRHPLPASRAVRRFRLCDIEPGDRGLVDATRSRRAERLVRIHRDPDRGDGLRPRSKYWSTWPPTLTTNIR
jgi:Major Facilitator Superfamily